MNAEPRPGLRDTAPYVSPQLDAPARLNTNECPQPLPEGFSDDLAATIRELPVHRYPDGQMRELREALSARTGHPFDGIWPANGSNEVLTQLLQAYGGNGRRALTFEPTYLLHSRVCWLTQTSVVHLRLPAGFVLTELEVEGAAAERPHVVFVCSPNNPTGNAQPVQAIEALVASLPDSLVIVDEAYQEFGGETALKLVSGHPNVAVVRTFSKALAMAGVRLGYVLTSPDVVTDLQRVRLPYHLSALTQAAGICGLRHQREADELLEAIRSQRDRIAGALRAVPGMTVYPSDANFVLFVPPIDAVELWQGLLDRGVLIRDMTAVVPGALRVTAGSPHEVDLFLSALKEVLS